MMRISETSMYRLVGNEAQNILWMLDKENDNLLKYYSKIKKGQLYFMTYFRVNYDHTQQPCDIIFIVKTKHVKFGDVNLLTSEFMEKKRDEAGEVSFYNDHKGNWYDKGLIGTECPYPPTYERLYLMWKKLHEHLNYIENNETATEVWQWKDITSRQMLYWKPKRIATSEWT